jgi:hypothetical protein
MKLNKEFEDLMQGSMTVSVCDLFHPIIMLCS